VEHKADYSPLTRADKEANAVICDGLARIGKRRWDEVLDGWLLLFPGIPPAVAPHIPIVSEENQQVAHETRKVMRATESGIYCWPFSQCNVSFEPCIMTALCWDLHSFIIAACPAFVVCHWQGYQYSWCVDPLDGTKEFLKRNGQFTVNIALLHGSRLVLGVVAVPVDVGGHRPALQSK
jgi:3'-phosphoadenosine 5'-phosphosulfate (PAPS) 3'-phosphatase